MTATRTPLAPGVSLATVGLLGFVSCVVTALALFWSGCGSGDLQPVLDLAQRARHSAFHRETPGYEFSGSAENAALASRGWSAPEVRPTDRLSFAWAVNREASLDFLLLDPNTVWLHFRCWHRPCPPAKTSASLFVRTGSRWAG